MERPTCATCPYWSEKTALAEELRDVCFIGDDASAGLCRRFPPPLEFEATEGDSPIHVGSWRCTTTDDWCGEHPRFPAYLDALDRARIPRPSATPAPPSDSPPRPT